MSKKNLNLAKNIALVTLTSLLFIFCFVYFVQSYSYYADEYGTDISFDQDYVAIMLVALVLVVYTVYILVMDLKNQKKNPNAYYATFGVASAVLVCYPLGVFFKALNKANLNEEAFMFNEYQSYFFVAVLGLALGVYLVFSYLQANKD